METNLQTMVNTMEPQPLRAPELTTARNILHKRFDKLRKWHEEQQERLNSIQEIRRQKFQEEQFNSCSVKFGNLELRDNNVIKDKTSTKDYAEVSENTSGQKRCAEGTDVKVTSTIKSDGSRQTNTVLQRNDEEKPIKSRILGGTSFEELLEQKLSHEKLHKESEESSKPFKRPFLQKGSGLKRYYSTTPLWMQSKKKISPKKKRQLVTQNKKPQHLITKLKLQRTRHAADTTDHKGNEDALECNSLVNTHKSLFTNNLKENKGCFNSLSSMKYDPGFSKHYKELEKQHQIESVELAEFEMLEEAAENTSFISDCSLVAEKTNSNQVLPVSIEKQNTSVDINVNDDSNKNQEIPDKETSVGILEENLMTQSTQLKKLLHDVKFRHQVLLNKMANTSSPENRDTELSVIGEEASLTGSDAESYSSDDSVIQLSATLPQTNVSSSPAKEAKDDSFNDSESWKDSIHLDSAAMSEAEFEDSVVNWAHHKDPACSEESKSHVLTRNANEIDNEKDILPKQPVEPCNDEHIKEGSIVARKDAEQKIKDQSTYSNAVLADATLLAERYNIQQKTKELEEEIATFKKENESLIVLRKQREQALQQLEKERKEIANYKEEIKKSLEEEVNEGRRQLYRERQNFERYQKMKRNYPDKMERETVSALRQQVEKLQNDLKMLEMKSSTECRRLKSRLSHVEKERDGLKIAVKQLESQRVELLSVLKENQGKKQQVKKAIISLPSDLLPQTSVVKNKLENECLPKKEAIPSTKTIEDQKFAKEQKSDTLQAMTQKSNINFEEPDIVLDKIPEKSDSSGIPLDIPSDGKKISSKKNQKVQFAGIPDDDTTTCLDSKEKRHGQKVEKIYSNGDREITFSSGTRKHISADGLTITINFYNGDWKQVLPDQRVIYHYAETNTTQTVYPDGSEIIEFASGQVESHSPNGTKHVVLPDGSKCTFYTDGSEQTVTIDGTVIKIDENGTEILDYPNGEREIRNQEFKKRKYPDGTEKILYTDGRQETRYANGRMRIKGKDGDIILDIQLPEL